MLDVSSGRSAEVGPPDTDVWEFDWDGDDLCVAIVSDGALRWIRLVSRATSRGST